MKKSVYMLILTLISLPAGLMLGLEIGTLERQYERAKKNFAEDVKEAISKSREVYNLWHSHSSSVENTKTYNYLYVNPDSTFWLMIAQSAQSYPLLNFKPDTLLPKIRKAQFLKFKDELEKTRRKENTHLREFYILRTIQYCTDCEKNKTSIAEVFPMDSLIKQHLKQEKITTDVQIAFFNLQQNKYSRVSQHTDYRAWDKTPFKYKFTDREEVRLYFPCEREAILYTLFMPFLVSLFLVSLTLSCYGLAARMIYQQKKLSEMKNDFINNMSHEFKTPIATITFAIANIENEQVLHNPEAIKQFTKVIKDENKRLNTQVEKVLQAAIIDQKAIELKKEPVNLHQIINDLADAYEVKLSKRGNIYRRLNALNAQVCGDAFHLSNAISNLLDNAIKYSSEEIDILILTENKDKMLVISVVDKGDGISKEQQSLIFEKFYRVPTGNVHNVKGFGLGLTYVKAIAEQHQGRVSVQSRLQKGSIFSLELPFLQ